MSIQYDPQKIITTNMQHGESHNIGAGTMYRVVTPTHAPFFYDSLVVKQDGKILHEQVDYFVSHPYAVGTHKTAQLTNGSLWIINDNLKGSITVDYHPLGINTATAQQIADERERNKALSPSELDWDEVVGDMYFPPVDVLFDRDDWRGEAKLIECLNTMSEQIACGGWGKAVLTKTQGVHTHPQAKNIAPTYEYSKSYGVFVVKKEITFNEDNFLFQVYADNTAELYIDGQLISTITSYPSVHTESISVTPGTRTVAIVCRNGTGPSFLNFAITEINRPVVVSDQTWPCVEVLPPRTVEESVLMFGADDDIIQLCQGWLDQLQAMYDSAPAHEHVVNVSNPHNEEFGWIHALQRDGISRASVIAFGKTLAQLTSYVNERCQTTSDLSNKIPRAGWKNLHGELLLANGHGGIVNKITPSTHGSIINLMVGGVDAYGRANVVTTARNNKPLRMLSGKNELILYPDDRALTYNGLPIVTRDTIGGYVPVAGDGSDEVRSKNTTTVKMTGKGTHKAPLVINWNVPDKATSALTLRPNHSDWGKSKAHAATPALLLKLEQIFPQKIRLATATINGKKLNNSVYLTGADFGLSQVANLADKYLPISTAQRAMLGNYVTSAHTHPFSSFGYGSATTNTKGIFKLRPAEDDTASALRAQDVTVENLRIPAISDAIDNLMPAGVITIVRYGMSGDSLISGITSSGWTLTFPTAIPHYSDILRSVPPTTINLKELFPLMAEEQIFYVYVNVVQSVAVYVIYDYAQAEDEILTFIGTVNVNEVGVSQINIKNTTRLGKFRELEDHSSNVDAHVTKPKDRDDIGLGSLVNAPPSFEIVKPTFQEIFSTWKRFSHGALSTTGTPNYAVGDAQPANTSELNSWVYDQATDTLKQSANTGSYVGFISPTIHEVYTFDTVMSSDAADNDGISVVIGFVTDAGGKEHTLSMQCRQDGLYGSLKGTALVYNAQQTTQVVIMRPVVNLTGHGNWVNTGTRRVVVIRDSDSYTVEIYKQNDIETVEETYHFNISTGAYDSYVNDVKAQTGTFSASVLNTIKMFRGAQPFGYSSQSQANSTFKNLKRPDEDGKNFYATLPGMLEGISPLARTRTYSGVLPALIGKTYSQAVALIPLPVIKNFTGAVVPMTKDRVLYYINGDRWMMVCHLEPDMLVTQPN